MAASLVFPSGDHAPVPVTAILFFIGRRVPVRQWGRAASLRGAQP